MVPDDDVEDPEEMEAAACLVSLVNPQSIKAKPTPMPDEDLMHEDEDDGHEVGHANDAAATHSQQSLKPDANSNSHWSRAMAAEALRAAPGSTASGGQPTTPDAGVQQSGRRGRGERPSYAAMHNGTGLFGPIEAKPKPSSPAAATWEATAPGSPFSNASRNNPFLPPPPRSPACHESAWARSVPERDSSPWARSRSPAEVASRQAGRGLAAVGHFHSRAGAANRGSTPDSAATRLNHATAFAWGGGRSRLQRATLATEADMAVEQISEPKPVGTSEQISPLQLGLAAVDANDHDLALVVSPVNGLPSLAIKRDCGSDDGGHNGSNQDDKIDDVGQQGGQSGQPITQDGTQQAPDSKLGKKLSGLKKAAVARLQATVKLVAAYDSLLGLSGVALQHNGGPGLQQLNQLALLQAGAAEHLVPGTHPAADLSHLGTDPHAMAQYPGAAQAPDATAAAMLPLLLAAAGYGGMHQGMPAYQEGFHLQGHPYHDHHLKEYGYDSEAMQQAEEDHEPAHMVNHGYPAYSGHFAQLEEPEVEDDQPMSGSLRRRYQSIPAARGQRGRPSNHHEPSSRRHHGPAAVVSHRPAGGHSQYGSDGAPDTASQGSMGPVPQGSGRARESVIRPGIQWNSVPRKRPVAAAADTAASGRACRGRYRKGAGKGVRGGSYRSTRSE